MARSHRSSSQHRKLALIISNDMMENIQHFAKTTTPDDLILFYYYGHSYQSGGENYLIPAEDDTKTNEALDLLPIKVKNIIKRLAETRRSYETILIFDCCRPYLWPSASTSNPTISGQGLVEIKPPARTFIQFACDANRTSPADLFTKHLLKSITQENVDITGVFRRIVADVCLESNKCQRPLSMKGLSEYEIYLNEVMSSLPDIPYNATWKSSARTVAGGYGPGHTLNRLHCPKGLCVNNNQTVFIADGSNHRIMAFSSGVRTGRRFAGKNSNGYAPDRLSRPSSVIFDKGSKSFIICDYGNRRVLQWFRRSTTYAKVLIEDIECCGMAMDDQGSLYISDTGRHEVRRYRSGDISGTVVAGGHGQGRSLHQLNHPTYICIGRNQAVYVSDSWNNRVMKWEKDAKEGAIVAGGQGAGSNLTQLHCPAGIVVDRLDRVYVADYWNNRVMQWHTYRGKLYRNNIAGGLIPGDGAKQLNGPEGLAFDRYGNLYVADSQNHRIQRFNIMTS
ncbi:unnamed protein product [Didymodactylos carnosus]|uniref:Uncharacterized protein n=1 Tax=Didymodactylos carnosus TaxID=1234261 RepID=A0A814HZC7_9BILA|nr:unnamed protein product [Didymodactylos carnosus]CAF1016657.1 unnamed protein product [Didymodactylos carnosus]CAF3758761.1 unnamed protein product [Didymodactylos carnosus]CAF3788202.1 unnamed protein product [Didymodactylos carnosus]